MAKITGYMIGKEVVEALKLGSGVQQVDVHIGINELATVTVKRMVEDHEARALLKVMEKYHLHQVDECESPVSDAMEVQGMDEEFVRIAEPPEKPINFREFT